MKSLKFALAAMALGSSVMAQNQVLPTPGAPSAVARSGPIATTPAGVQPANSPPAQLPVQPQEPAIPTTTAQPLNTLAPINPIPGSNPPTVQQKPVTTILPSGAGTYTYYKEANTYYNPRTRTYYYQQSGEWRAGVSAPVGKHLEDGSTVQLEGQSNVNGANQ